MRDESIVGEMYRHIGADGCIKSMILVNCSISSLASDYAIILIKRVNAGITLR